VCCRYAVCAVHPAGGTPGAAHCHSGIGVAIQAKLS